MVADEVAADTGLGLAKGIAIALGITVALGTLGLGTLFMLSSMMGTEPEPQPRPVVIRSPTKPVPAAPVAGRVAPVAKADPPPAPAPAPPPAPVAKADPPAEVATVRVHKDEFDGRELQIADLGNVVINDDRVIKLVVRRSIDSPGFEVLAINMSPHFSKGFDLRGESLELKTDTEGIVGFFLGSLGNYDTHEIESHNVNGTVVIFNTYGERLSFRSEHDRKRADKLAKARAITGRMVGEVFVLRDDQIAAMREVMDAAYRYAVEHPPQ